MLSNWIWRSYILVYIFSPFVTNIGKNVSGKYSQKLKDRSKQSATDAIKTASKREIQKTAEATGNFFADAGNEIADEIKSTASQGNPEIAL